MPRRQFAMTLRMWAEGGVNEMTLIRREAAGLLALSLTQGGRYGPGTPVKTGRLLSGWTAESRAGGRTSVGAKGPGGDPRDQPDVQRARVPAWITRVKRIAGRADLRIFTAVPYAIYVEEGHPTKRAFIATVRANWPRIVADARKIARGQRIRR